MWKRCPKSAITNADGTIVEKKPRDQWYKPAIDVGQCSVCSKCVDICDIDCLEITYPQLKGDLNVHANLANPDKRMGCGMCENMCPLHAITIGKSAGKCGDCVGACATEAIKL